MAGVQVCKRGLHSACRRVVVTGVGIASPLGVGVDRVWKRLLDGDVGTVQTDFDGCEVLPSKVAAYTPKGEGEGEYNQAKYEGKGVARFTGFALCAAEEAMCQSQLGEMTDDQLERAGVAIGSAVGDIEGAVEGGVLLEDRKRGLRRLSPFFIPQILINLAGGHVSLKYKLRGPNHAAVTACASGAHSIADAAKLIRDGDADVMVTGGTEACIGMTAMAGFCRMKALCSTYNDNPSLASRPFDVDRAGFVMGEGAGVLVLEERERAMARNADILAEIVGIGMAGDGHHLTSPPQDGDGARRAMQAALRSAGVEPGVVGYINAHGTSTPMGDKAELHAIETVFGSTSSLPFVSSTKGALGHLLGAAGAVEAIITVMALRSKCMPGTANLTTREPGFEKVPLLAHAQEHAGLEYAMSNSFGFGGTNASLLFARHRA